MCDAGAWMGEEAKNVTLEEALGIAVERQRAQDFDNAEKIYRTILERMPQHPEAKALLALLQAQRQRTLNPSLTAPILRRAAFEHRHHYSAVLPYNLNWMVQCDGALADCLRKDPVVVVDIGARGDAPGELEGLKPAVHLIAFDADEAACARLRAQPPQGFASYSIHPYFLGSQNGAVDFHLYRAPGCSSLFLPAESFQKDFADENFVIERTVSVQSRTLDAVREQHALPTPDFIKLDTQGTELAILQASPRALAETNLVEIEVEFVEVYRGQPLFDEVFRFLYDNGFELLYLNRAFQNRKGFAGEARGQLTFADALFARTPAKIGDRSPLRLLKYVTLLINYGHLDLAFDIYRRNLNDIDRLVPDGSLMAQFAGTPDKEGAELSAQLDKLLVYLLHSRKTNRLACDSDRSWPFR